MTSTIQAWVFVGLLACLIAVPASVLVSGERRNSKNVRAPQPDAESVEMFAAIESKQIEVKLIPKDDTESRVMIKNNSNKPLNIKLPEAFAGVPVLLQRGAGGIGGGNRGGAAPGGQNQTMGGGMGGMGGGGMGMGMGMMNVPAERVAQFKVATVCLEHGKKEPRPNIPYDIKPIESFSSKPELKELLTAFGKQRLNQRVAQAAAWHISNDMSWEQLANKRIEHLDGTSDPWFSLQEIQAAMQLAQHAIQQADAKAREGSSASPTQSASASPEN